MNSYILLLYLYLFKHSVRSVVSSWGEVICTRISVWKKKRVKTQNSLNQYSVSLSRLKGTTEINVIK